jgi:hypothetical protein
MGKHRPISPVMGLQTTLPMTCGQYLMIATLAQMAIILPVRAQTTANYPLGADSSESPATNVRGEMNALIAAGVKAGPSSKRTQTSGGAISDGADLGIDCQFDPQSQPSLRRISPEAAPPRLFLNELPGDFADPNGPSVLISADLDDKDPEVPSRLSGSEERPLLNPPTNGTLRLAPLVVRGNGIIKIPEAKLYTHDAFMKRIMKRYLTEFDYGFLNRFTLPLYGSASREKRAMEAYERDQMTELKELSGAFGKSEVDLHGSGSFPKNSPGP